MNDKEFLEHFGILGMHWGRRKGKQTTPGSSDHEIATQLKTKKLHEMSNVEIKKLTERLQLERQYKDLTKEELHPGKKFVMDMITNNAKRIATEYVSKYLTTAAATVLNKNNIASTVKNIVKKPRTIGFGR